MIAIDRGDEPEELLRERTRRLSRIVLAQLAGGPRPAATDGYRLNSVTRPLGEAQQFKCAFCELPIDEGGYPLEHFRPKDAATMLAWDPKDKPPSLGDTQAFFTWFEQLPVHGLHGRSSWDRAQDGYFWLAWTWENLFYACPACNTDYKGTRFPCAPESSPLKVFEQPPLDEQPLLLDPSSEDPLDRIRFAPDLLGDDWGPVALTDLGRWTIAMLGLHERPGLRSHWKAHVKTVRSDVDYTAMLKAVQREEAESARRHWALARERLLAEYMDFQALRWCVFDMDVPGDIRGRYGLALPRPGRRAKRVSRPAWQVHLPELGAFSWELQLRVSALGDSDDKAKLEELIVDLCRERGLGVGELAALLRRQSPTVQEYLRELSGGSAPRLVFEGDTATYRAL